MCYHIENEIHENMDERMSVDISQYPLVECSTSSKLHYIVSDHSNEFVGDMWQALRVKYILVADFVVYVQCLYILIAFAGLFADGHHKKVGFSVLQCEKCKICSKPPKLSND